MSRWTALEGAPGPLGVSYVAEDGAYNFALYSKHATGVRLLLYAAKDPVNPLYTCDFDARINKSSRVWHCRVPAGVIDHCTYYAYQVDGPYQPAEGQMFDPHKILLDPYARGVFFPPQFSREAATRRGLNAGRAPLGIIHSDGAAPPASSGLASLHTHDTIIYELHVRGFTKRDNSGVAPKHRGTFLGIVDKFPISRTSALRPSS